MCLEPWHQRTPEANTSTGPVFADNSIQGRRFCSACFGPDCCSSEVNRFDLVIRAARRFLDEGSLGQQFVAALAGSAGLRIAGMGFGFLVGVQLARGLGTEGYGVYGLAMSLLALLTVPVEFGLPQLVTREVAVAHSKGDWDKLGGVLRWSGRVSLWATLIVVTGTVAGIILSGHGLDSGLGITLLAGLMLVPLVAQGNIYCAALRGLQQIVRGQLPQVLARPMLFSALLLLAPLVLVPLSPPVAMLLGVISAGCVLILAARLLKLSIGSQMLACSPHVTSRYWWSSAVPMALTEGMRVVQGHLLILLLGVMSTEASVGIFRVATSVALIVAVPVTLFNVINAPLLARLHDEGDRARMQRLLSWSALAMTLSTLVLMSPFILAGEQLLHLVFGAEFAAGDHALVLLLCGVLANSIFGCCAILLNMTGHHARVTRASAIALFMLFVLSPVLIDRSGYEGAALASAITALTWNALMWWDARRLLRLDTGLLSFFRQARGGAS